MSWPAFCASLVFNQSVKYEVCSSRLIAARAPNQGSANLTWIPHNYLYA